MYAHLSTLFRQSCTLSASPQLANGWEKHLNKVVKMMLAKKQLVHANGHMGSFRLSKAMAAKEEKRLARKPRVMKVGAHKYRYKLLGLMHKLAPRLAATPDDPVHSACQVAGSAFSVGPRLYRPSFLVQLQAEKAGPMEKKAAASKKRTAAKKMEGPAKRAKKAAPKK